MAVRSNGISLAALCIVIRAIDSFRYTAGLTARAQCQFRMRSQAAARQLRAML